MSTSARTASGDLALPRVVVTNVDQCILQKVIDGFSLWLGSWFLDQGAGFPWLQRVLGVVPAPSSAEIAALIRQKLLSINGIVSVSAVASLNTRTRAFSYNFQAQLNSGAVLTGGSGVPFQVTGAP